MKKVWLAFILLGISFSSILAAPSDQGPGEEAKIALAEQFVDLLSGGQYPAAVEHFDETMAAAMSAEALAAAWQSIQAQAGNYLKRTGTRTEQYQKYLLVFVTCEFERATLDTKVVVDPDGKVAGLWFLPHTPPAEYGPPPYARPDAFEESEVTVSSGEWALPGTLTLPRGDGQFPAVILVHGSGPQDRNESIGPNRPFCDLAWGLASRGIAVFRYDKRTRVHQAEMAAMVESLTVWQETVEDALLAAASIETNDRIDNRRIYVLGHSLGGMLIPRIARRGRALAGFIVMAGPARPLEDGILEQMEYLYTFDGSLTEQEKDQLNRLEVQVGRVKEPDLSISTPRQDLPLGLPAAYWLDLRGYHPPEAAAEIDRPLLILQGERDYQVAMKDFLIWKRILAGHDNVRFKSYPELNHLFMSGEGRSMPDEYNLPGHVSRQVIEDISDWVLSR